METKEKCKHLAIMTACSLFAQGIHWYLYEKIQFESALLWVTPLILCALYHAVQQDSGKGKLYSRKFVFFCIVALPFIIGIIGSAAVFISHPELSLYHEGVVPDGSFPELLGLFFGRLLITSGYMGIFALPDLLLLQYIDGRKQA